jgi:hypothetical protein
MDHRLSVGTRAWTSPEPSMIATTQEVMQDIPLRMLALRERVVLVCSRRINDGGAAVPVA